MKPNKCLKCGAKPDVWETIAPTASGSDAVVYDVQCPICGMATSYGYGTKDAAVSAWNSREYLGAALINRKYARIIT